MRRGGAFAFLTVHLRDLAAQRKAQNDPQQNDDRQDDHALQVRIAYRADDVSGHQELKTKHQRIFEREPQLDPGVARQAAARAHVKKKPASPEDGDDLASHDDKYADKFNDGP